MKLWVRSQNKEELVCVKSISYDVYCPMDKYHHRIMGDCGGDATYFLGEYKSKERCLEIIDEIQSLFCDFLICKDVSPCDHPQFQKLGLTSIHYIGKDFEPKLEYHERSSIVYEMPQE